MKRAIYFILSIALGGQFAHSLVIETTSGKLVEHKMALELTTDNAVVIKGTANVTDLDIIKSMSDYVKELDLSQLAIEAYTYPASADVEQHSFAAGELPSFMMAGVNITNFKFPSNSTKVGTGAFSSSKLQSVEIPKTVTTIGDYAFAGCKSLRSVKIEGEAALGIGAFKDCKELQSVKFNGKISAIPPYLFDGCLNYSESLPAQITTVGDYAYRGTGLVALNLRNISKIGTFAFADMPRLESVVYSNDNIDLSPGVFFNSKELNVLPAFSADAPDLLLAHSNAKSDYVIHSPKIGEAAYANNRSIDTITFGPEVKSISRHAFRNLENLAVIDASLLNSVPEVDEDAFSGLKNDIGRYNIKLNVKKEYQNNWLEHPVWSLFEIGQYDTGVAQITDEDPAISVMRNGETISVNADASIDYVIVYTLDGMKMAEVAPMTTEAEINGMPSDQVLIVNVKAGDINKIIKLR